MARAESKISRSVMGMVLLGAARTSSQPAVRNRRAISAKKNGLVRVSGTQSLLVGPAKVLKQKGTGVAPQPVGRTGRNVQGRRRLCCGEACEESEFDQPGGLLVAAGQPVEGVGQGEEVLVSFRG